MIRGGNRTAGQVRSRWQWGVGTTCALLAAGVVAGAGALLLSRVRADGIELVDERLQRDAAEVERRLEAESRELDASLQVLERRLRTVESGNLRRALAGPVEAYGLAAVWMEMLAVDGLELLDEEGRVVSSGQFPERAGERIDARSLREEPTAPRMVAATLAGGVVPVIRVARRVSFENRTLHTIAERRLEGLLGTVASDARLVLRIGGEAPLTWVRPARRDLASGASPPTGEAILDAPGIDRSGHRAAIVIGFPGAEIELVSSYAPMARRVERLRIVLLLAGLVAAAIGALVGVVVARRLYRPVGSLLDAFEEVAAGRADYDLVGNDRDELQGFAAGFSRMNRALRFHRERSRAAERVAAWRDLARQVAHEVKNPLAPIRLTVDNLRRARTGAPERFGPLFEEGMTVIGEEVDQLGRLVGEFSEFARLPSPRLVRGDALAIVESVLKLYTREPGLEIRREVFTPIPRVDLDADQLSRALKNVVGNAVEAMRESAADPARLTVSVREEDGELRIDVDDTGPGLPDGEEARIFRPYVTTRSGGTGLGLALTYRIVTEHRGLIVAGNLPTGGARFTIRLPPSGDAPARNETQRTHS